MIVAVTSWLLFPRASDLEMYYESQLLCELFQATLLFNSTLPPPDHIGWRAFV